MFIGDTYINTAFIGKRINGSIAFIGDSICKCARIAKGRYIAFITKGIGNSSSIIERSNSPCVFILKLSDCAICLII